MPTGKVTPDTIVERSYIHDLVRLSVFLSSFLSMCRQTSSSLTFESSSIASMEWCYHVLPYRILMHEAEQQRMDFDFHPIVEFTTKVLVILAPTTFQCN